MMSLINTLHMVAREERFTEASNAPITDGSRCRPGVPFCAHPPVFFPFFFHAGSASLRQLLLMRLDSPPCAREGASEFCLRSTMKDASVYRRGLVRGITTGSDVNSCNKVWGSCHHARGKIKQISAN